MNATRIIVFAKAPVPGAVKTRLIPALGEVGAARLAERMLARTLSAAITADVGEPELCASPHPAAPDWASFRPTGVRMTDQGPGDLGERIGRAAARAIAAGVSVLLIGSDCPELDAERLKEAAARLAAHDAVIHPVQDGGYALLGLTRFDASLFAGIAWSTDSVAADTIARVRALGWTLHIGDTLRDVDEPADLLATEPAP